MPVTIEYAKNNDPRFDRCIPIMDLYLHDTWGDAGPYKENPELIRPYLEQLPDFGWFESVNALVLIDERIDIDLDNMVLVCFALMEEEHRVLRSLSNDELVPTFWARSDPMRWDATP